MMIQEWKCMKKILFVPLNSNHVIIFYSITKELKSDYIMLSHDYISESEIYHTEKILKKLNIPYVTFAKKLDRKANKNLLKKIITFVKMKSQVKNILEKMKPSVIILGLDHDPIAKTIISLGHKMRIKTILFQEGLILPHQHTKHPKYLSYYIYCILSCLGIHLVYTDKYGCGKCDKVVVGGKLPFQILKKRGTLENKLEIAGWPKYDSFFKRIKNIEIEDNNEKIYLFAARPTIIQDDVNKRFLIKLVESIKKLNLKLEIKLHPRSSLTPSDIYNFLKIHESSFIKIIKEGDETFEILTRSYAVVTDFSTVGLEALILDKECIAANYLSGDNRFEYNEYDAIYTIESEDQIFSVLKDSSQFKKSNKNKRKLLKDEMYKLDGYSSLRAADIIEKFIKEKN